MAVITIYGERSKVRCQELEAQIRTSGCQVKFGNPADLKVSDGKNAAGDCTMATDESGKDSTYLARGSVLIPANRSDQTTSLLY